MTVDLTVASMTGTVVSTLCHWLADELGCSALYTVPGEAFLPLLAEAPDHAIATIATRHESGAGFMAIAAAQLSGVPGVVAVNRAPGSCNVAIAVDAAGVANVPIVVIVGDIDADAPPATAFQNFDPDGLFGDKALVVRLHPTSIGAQLSDALTVLSGAAPRPVVLVVNEDIWMRPTDTPLHTPPEAPARTLDETTRAATRIRAALRRSQRPVLIIGDLARTARADQHAHDTIEALASIGRFPILVGNKQDDILDHASPTFGGHLHLGSPLEMRERLAQADLVVLLGQRPDDVCTSRWQAPAVPGGLGPEVIVVHPSTPVTRDEWWSVDVRAVAADLAGPEPIDGATAVGWIEDWHDSASAYRTYAPTSYPDGVDFGAVVDEIDKQLTGEANICLDAGNFSSWVHRYLPGGPRRRVLALPNGAMGFGIPAAVAAAHTQPDRVSIAIVGDGGVMMTGNELATARSTGHLPVVVVADNSSYGTIDQHARRRHPGAVCATDLTTPDLVLWASAFGLSGEYVDDVVDVAPAISRALASGRDGYLLHVRTSLVAGHANSVPTRTLARIDRTERR